MKASVFMILLLFFSSILLPSSVEDSGDAGVSASIGVETPIPRNKKLSGKQRIAYSKHL